MRAVLGLFVATICLVAVQIVQGQVRITGTAIVDVYSDNSSEDEEASATSSSSEATSEETANLASELGIRKEELTERRHLVEEIKKLPIWNGLSVVQQERLRTAVLKNTKVPLFWKTVRGNSGTFDSKNNECLENIRHHLCLRNFMMAVALLPQVPNEENIATAERQSWWQELCPCQRRAISRLILKEKNVPEGWTSWSAAINSEKFGEWILDNKDELLAKKCSCCNNASHECKCEDH